MQPIAIVLQRDNCLIEMGAKWNGGTNAFHEMLAGEPDVGNPQVRFDEGEQWNPWLIQAFHSVISCLSPSILKESSCHDVSVVKI